MLTIHEPENVIHKYGVLETRQRVEVQLDSGEMAYAYPLVDPNQRKNMITIKDAARELIGPMNYKEDTKVLTEKVYKRFGLDIARVSGNDLLYGSAKTPTLMSVIRRVQIVKKSIARKVLKVENMRREREEATDVT